MLTDDLERVGLVDLVVLAAGLAAVAFLVYRAYAGPRRRVRAANITDAAQRLGVENELRKTNFEIIAALLLIIGVAFTYLQLQATRAQLAVNTESQASDRLAKALGNISSDKQADQVGGMYALRNLAVDAAAKGDRSYVVVMDETLSAFIRHKMLCVTSCQPRPDTAENRNTYIVVQVALSILGDRDDMFRTDDLAKLRTGRLVDLRNVDLRNAQLRGLHLVRVDFRQSNLSSSDLTDTDLRGADLRGVVLDGAVGRDTVRDDESTKWY